MTINFKTLEGFIKSVQSIDRKKDGAATRTIAKVAGAVAIGTVGAIVFKNVRHTLQRYMLIRKLKKKNVLSQKELDDYVDVIDHPFDYDASPENRGVLMRDGWIQRGMYAGNCLDDVAEVMSHKTWSYEQAKYQAERLGHDEKELLDSYLGTKIKSEEFKKTRQINEKISSVTEVREVEYHTHLVLPPTQHHHHMGNELITIPRHEDYPELSQEWKDLIKALHEHPNFKWVGTHDRIPCSHNSCPMRTVLEHPDYGKYGYYDYPLKEDFFAIARSCPVRRNPTKSTAVDNHLAMFLPRWNRNDPMTLGHGAAGRLGREPVPPDQVHMDIMEPFIERAVDIIIDQLTLAGLHPMLITPELSWRWLAKQQFPRVKKQKYCEAFASVTTDDDFIMPNQFRNKHEAFAKNENYAGATKAQRLILAGDYQMAAVLAPACDILGDYVFSRPFTSKKIPETLRPRVALDRFPGRVVLNDMSAFEGSITGRMKDLIEHRILNHFFPNIRPWLERANEDLNVDMVDRISKAKIVRFHLDTVRCSGDPQTSLGNTLTNYATILAARMWAKIDGFEDFARSTVAWVEGDDSILHYDFEDDQEFARYRQAFINMGFAAKMEVKEFVGDAGYCSQFFDRQAHNCPRVAQTLIDFPWSHSSYLGHGMELLALKALSLQASCPGQPIVYGLMRRYCNLQGVAVLEHNAYAMEEMERQEINVMLTRKHMAVNIRPFIPTEPSEQQRILFYLKYGITVGEQNYIEHLIVTEGLSKIPDHYLRRFCEVDGIDYDSCRKFYDDNVAVEKTISGTPFIATICRRGTRIFRFKPKIRRVQPPEPAPIPEPIDPVPRAVERLKTIEEIRRRHSSDATYKSQKLSRRHFATYAAVFCVFMFAKFLCKKFDFWWFEKICTWVLVPQLLKLVSMFCGDLTEQAANDIRDLLAL